MTRPTRRVGPREGYDRWSRTYDEADNPLVALDGRETLEWLRPQSGERILDAGCGTGRHIKVLNQVGAATVGLDFSAGMLLVARDQNPGSSLIQADLNRQFPLASGTFDAVLCTLVSEHLADVSGFFTQVFAVLRPGGRLIFSAFHPDLAAEGVEANFEWEGIEYRLGAELYSVADYLSGSEGAGFESIRWQEFECDDALVSEVPSGARRLGKNLLLLVEARRPGGSEQ